MIGKTKETPFVIRRLPISQNGMVSQKIFANEKVS